MSPLTAEKLKALISQVAATRYARQPQKFKAERLALHAQIDAEIDRLYAADAVAERVYPLDLVTAYVKASSVLATRAQTMLIEAIARDPAGADSARDTAVTVCEYARATRALVACDARMGLRMSEYWHLAAMAGIVPMVLAGYICNKGAAK